jgi:murein DD-endopeptidase MepM/ murein hydrolase activator NlpD
MGASPASILELIEASKDAYNLRKVKSGHVLTVFMDGNSPFIKRLEYPINEREILVASHSGDSFWVAREELAFDRKPHVVSGAIRNSLYEDALAAGLTPDLTLKFADIFAWDVDFFVDVREGDTFRVLFEALYHDGEWVANGDILAAEFRSQQKKVLKAFRFDAREGRPGYYNENGRSLRRQFLRSPLRYSRISSGFSYRRFHPILRVYRPHEGIDYAAPAGTPVEAVGDGRVVFAGWKNGYGRTVRVRHTHVYSTQYAHLSRFAKGVRNNARVKQGQVIGYVGATGLATGPHLDFRLIKNGKFINPLKFSSPRSASVARPHNEEFSRRVRILLAEMEGLEPRRSSLAQNILSQ